MVRMVYPLAICDEGHSQKLPLKDNQDRRVEKNST